MEKLPDDREVGPALIITAQYVYGRRALILFTTEIVPADVPIPERKNAPRFVIKKITSHFASSLARRVNGHRIPAEYSLREAVANVGAEVLREVERKQPPIVRN